MIRHDHVSADNKVVASPHSFKRTLEEFARRRCAKMPQAVIAAKSNDVETAALLITNKPLRHASILHPMSQKRDMGHPPKLLHSSRLGETCPYPPDAEGSVVLQRIVPLPLTDVNAARTPGDGLLRSAEPFLVEGRAIRKRSQRKVREKPQLLIELPISSASSIHFLSRHCQELARKRHMGFTVATPSSLRCLHYSSAIQFLRKRLIRSQTKYAFLAIPIEGIGARYCTVIVVGRAVIPQCEENKKNSAPNTQKNFPRHRSTSKITACRSVVVHRFRLRSSSLLPLQSLYHRSGCFARTS